MIDLLLGSSVGQLVAVLLAFHLVIWIGERRQEVKNTQRALDLWEDDRQD
jgi:hypothetical protein